MMKKLVSVLLICCLALGLTACKGEEEQKNVLTCSMEQNGVTIKMSFDAKGDTITRITQESVINTESYDEDQIAMIETAVEEAAAAYKEIDGIEYSTEQGDTELIEKIIIPTDKDTLQAVVKAGLLPVDDEDVTELSLKSTQENLESMGWTSEE